MIAEVACPLKTGYGFAAFSEIQQDGAECMFGDGGILKTHRLSKFLLRLRQPAGIAERRTQRIMRNPQARSQIDHFLVRRYSILVVSSVHIKGSELLIVAEIARLELNRLLNGRQGFIKLAILVVNGAQTPVGIAVVGLNLDGALVVRHGWLIPSRRLLNQTGYDMNFGQVHVAKLGLTHGFFDSVGPGSIV